jgi:hypothetical protein
MSETMLDALERRCIDLTHPVATTSAVEDLGDKLGASLILSSRKVWRLGPSEEEWIGLEKLSRDGELRLPVCLPRR